MIWPYEVLYLSAGPLLVRGLQVLGIHDFENQTTSISGRYLAPAILVKCCYHYMLSMYEAILEIPGFQLLHILIRFFITTFLVDTVCL